MKLKFLFLIILASHAVFSQSEKDILLEKDIVVLVEEMEFMYGYDQVLREYSIFKTFDKSETDSIEKLPDSLRLEVLKQRRFSSDSLSDFIYKEYINPKDAKHTERMLEITKKYGFPSVDRIRKYYKKAFIDPEFNPYILLVHSPAKYWEELKIVMKQELDQGRINRCTYGHMLWHVNGRNDFKHMLDNGYVMTVENGQTKLKSTCN